MTSQLPLHSTIISGRKFLPFFENDDWYNIACIALFSRKSNNRYCKIAAVWHYREKSFFLLMSESLSSFQSNTSTAVLGLPQKSVNLLAMLVFSWFPFHQVIRPPCVVYSRCVFWYAIATQELFGPIDYMSREQYVPRAICPASNVPCSLPFKFAIICALSVTLVLLRIFSFLIRSHGFWISVSIVLFTKFCLRFHLWPSVYFIII